MIYELEMGARRHGQEEGTCPPPWKCYKVFCALVVTVKRSVDQVFMHHFHNFSSASGGRIPHPDPAGGLSSPDPLICPPLEKNLAGTVPSPMELDLLKMLKKMYMPVCQNEFCSSSFYKVRVLQTDTQTDRQFATKRILPRRIPMWFFN